MVPPTFTAGQGWAICRGGSRHSQLGIKSQLRGQIGLRYDSEIGYHCNIACFISIHLIEQKLQAPSPAMVLGRQHVISNSFQVSSGNIFACSDIEHGTQGDILQDVKENLVIMPSCLHAPLPSCPSSTLSSEDDVRW